MTKFKVGDTVMYHYGSFRDSGPYVVRGLTWKGDLLFEGFNDFVHGNPQCYRLVPPEPKPQKIKRRVHVLGYGDLRVQADSKQYVAFVSHRPWDKKKFKEIAALSASEIDELIAALTEARAHIKETRR